MQHRVFVKVADHRFAPGGDLLDVPATQPLLSDRFLTPNNGGKAKNGQMAGCQISHTIPPIAF
jgi:hypothetical protein